VLAPMANEPPDLLTAEEVARMLRVSTNTIRRWASLGVIPSVRLPTGVYRFRREAVQKLLEEEQDRDDQ
jgi:excisionase family DNA binding protein